MKTSSLSPALWKWRLGAIRGFHKAQVFSGVAAEELLALVAAGTLTAVPWNEHSAVMFSRRELMELLAAREAEAKTTKNRMPIAQNSAKIQKTNSSGRSDLSHNGEHRPLVFNSGFRLAPAFVESPVRAQHNGAATEVANVTPEPNSDGKWAQPQPQQSDSSNAPASGSTWSAGAMDTVAALKFLSCSKPTLRAIARQRKWPRRYQGTKVLYPRVALEAYLESLPSDPPPELKARAEQINTKVIKTT